jgi:CheY-like chemotaxis protein
MIERTLARPRILVIEDEYHTRDSILKYLRDISENTRLHHGIGDFEIDIAYSVSQAEQHLENAKTLSRPYDLVLLDLRLPKKEPGDGTENIEHGYDILNSIRKNQTAKGVIVVSNYDDYQSVVKSFRGGVVDFIGKPIFQESLEPAVLNALTRAMIQGSQGSNAILSQRVRDLATYAEKGLAHSFKLILYTLLQKVTEAAEGIEEYARERYGLEMEKDSNDSLMLKLRAHNKAVAQARQDWGGLQAELARGGKTLDVGNVSEMLRDLKESLLPCLVVKRVALDLPDFDEKLVLTFEKDVEVVLREIIVGALNELPDYGEEGQIRISFTIEDTRAKVSFEDDLDPIPEEKIEAINEGQRIIPDVKFGRVWGLSVAQHVALRGGGELKVETKRGRNVVTFYIPLADYA